MTNGQIWAVNGAFDARSLSGKQRAAVLMLAIGPNRGRNIWEQLGIDEIKELSTCIAQLGRIPSNIVEDILVEFSEELASSASVHGSPDATRILLEDVLPRHQLEDVLDDLGGPSGRTTWEKLANVEPGLFAAYLKNEYPQTIAVILSKLSSDHVASILIEFPDDLRHNVVMRMLTSDGVQKEIIDEIEQTLKSEFIMSLSPSYRRDPHETMADVVNAMDPDAERALLSVLDKDVPHSAARIRELMFTFENLAKLLPDAIGKIARKADRRTVALALKAAPEEARQVFYSTMTERATKLLREEIAAMGPVRASTCYEAQAKLVKLALSLAESGEITIADARGDGAIIY